MELEFLENHPEWVERIRELCAPLDTSLLTHGWVNSYGDECIALNPDAIRALPTWARKVFAPPSKGVVTAVEDNTVVGISVAHGGAMTFEARDRLIEAANSCLDLGSTPRFRERF